MEIQSSMAGKGNPELSVGAHPSAVVCTVPLKPSECLGTLLGQLLLQ